MKKIINGGTGVEVYEWKINVMKPLVSLYV